MIQKKKNHNGDTFITKIHPKNCSDSPTQKKLSREQKRNNELNQLIKKIYEDNVSSKLTDKRFEMLLSDYEQEQADLEASIQNTQKEISDYKEDNTRIDMFMEPVRKYSDFSELTSGQRREEERRRKKRAWNRTYMRRKYEREKAEREANWHAL